MTPSNPSPDTGAGTPLTVPRSCAFCNWNGDIGAAAHATIVHPDKEWTVLDQFGHEFVLARSRPATDPAGLDVETIERSLLNIRWLQKFIHLDPPIRRKLAHDLAAEYARLSVADGPGPEATVLVEDQERPLIWVDRP